MTKTKHTATAPNGQIFKRTSQNRVYSHVVLGRRSEENAFLSANSKFNRDHDGNSWDWRVKTSEGQGVYAKYASEAEDHWGRKRHEENLEEARQFLAANPDRKAYQDRKQADRVADVEKTDFTKWFDLGWASRIDLAQKNASTYAGKPSYAEVIIVEAVIG